MEEITRLQISRIRLRESFFYYDGCDTEKQKASEAEAANDRMIDLAADGLVAILLEVRASGDTGSYVRRRSAVGAARTNRR